MASQQTALMALIRRRLFGLQWRWEMISNRLFDLRYGTDTSREEPLVEQGVSESQAAAGNNIYRTYWQGDFSSAVRSISRDVSGYAFVDVGSGKGRMLLLAEKRGFSRIRGVEYASGLHEAATKNIDEYRRRTKTRADICAVNDDALSWPLMNEPTVYCLFNPFSKELLEQFFARLSDHVERYRLPTVVIFGYLSPLRGQDAAFGALRGFRCTARGVRHWVFERETC